MKTKICYKNPSKHMTIEYYCVLSFIDIFVSGGTFKEKTHENPNSCCCLTSSFLLQIAELLRGSVMLLPLTWTAETQDYYQNQQTDNLAHLQTSFTKQGCKYSNNENFILTLMHTRHIGSIGRKTSGTFTRQMFKPSTDFI
jgi:hypothetical protein